MDIATIRIERSPRVVFVTLVIASATVFCSEAYSQDLVRVDGVTTQCVVNQPRQVQNPGPASAVLFPSPQYGYCSGSIQHNCVTAKQPFYPQSSAYETISTACVGTFTDVHTQQAVDLANLQTKMQQQLDIMQKDINLLNQRLATDEGNLPAEIDKHAVQQLLDKIDALETRLKRVENAHSSSTH